MTIIHQPRINTKKTTEDTTEPKFELKPEDIEVEILAPGPIIHIFPKQDPYNAIEKILKGLYMMDSLQELYKEWEQTISSQEQPEYLIMAFAELKRVMDTLGLNSEKSVLGFMEKIRALKAENQ